MSVLKTKYDFSKKIVVITGGASGIGKETCIQFCHAGAKVIMGDINVVEGEKLIQSLKLFGYTIDLFITDISTQSGCRELIDYVISEHGRIDVLFNNAGIEISGAIVDFSFNDFQKLMTTNLQSVFLCSQYVLPHMMLEKSGNIINVASVASFNPWPNDAIYSVSKAGVAMLTKALALEGAPYSIRVNAIAPGIIDTPMTDRALSEYSDKSAAKIEKGKLHPLGRLGLTEEVARAVLFLSSDEASFITGVILPIDGGYLISG